MVRIGQHFSLSLIALVAILLAKPVTFLHPRVAAPPEQPPQAPLVVSAPQRFMTRDLPVEPSDERPASLDHRFLASGWQFKRNRR
jgi:hypothetical protein